MPAFSDIFNMSKKSGKNKKNAKKAKNAKIRKPLDKKTLWYIVAALCAVALIVGICLGVKISRKRKADRTVKIAFYGLSEEITELLKSRIPQEEEIILDFNVISEGSIDLQIVKDKYDMFFTWGGEITDALSDSAETMPSKVLETMPRSLRNKKCLPIVLDNCEFAYDSEVLKKLGKSIPVSFTDFNDFLTSAKGAVFSPFFCNGAEDRILIDLTGALVMSKGGLSAYNKLIEELRKAENLESVMDIPLDNSSLTLRFLLDMLKTWPREGLTHPSWYNGIGNDLLFFAQDKQLACFFTTLSEHRKIPYNVIRNYESALVPAEVNADNYGLIAPALSVMLLSDNANCKRYVAELFTEEAQMYFSDKTGLGPVHYQAQAYDRQADDVRFWAASCAGGAVPDLYLAVYQRKPDQLKEICAEIRNYVR